MKKWKVIDSRILVKSPWVTLRSDRCITENGVEIPNYYWLEGNHFVSVLGTTVDGKVVMVEQYRHGVKEVTLELPGGLIDEGEEPVDSAKREMLEETGYSSDEFVFVKELYISAGLADKKCHLFFARNLVRECAQNLERTENINIKLVDFGELQSYVDNNIIKGASGTAAALLALQKRDWFLGIQ